METESIELPTQEGYDRWSNFYDGEDNPLVVLETRHFGGWLGDVRKLSVLDVGCGTGRHALACARVGAEVTAIDFSSGMLAQARRKPRAERIRFVKHDIKDRLPLKDEQFDRIVCGLVLEHVPNLLTYSSR